MSESVDKAIGRRLEQAVLERVASAIENDMPMMHVELVLVSRYARLYRVTHPTYLNEAAYVRVTAHSISSEDANRIITGGRGPQDPASAWANPPTPR